MFQPQWVTPIGTIGTYASGSTVNFQLTANSTSGVYNMRYYIQSGNLPPGLTLDTYTGLISGTLNVYKTNTIIQFTIRAIDGDLNLKDRTFNITVEQDIPPNFITPSGNILTTNDCTWIYTTIPYTSSISDTDITMTIIKGSLPPGLSLSPNGVLQGYCSLVTLSTNYTATFKISNSLGSNTRNYSFTVNPSIPRLPVILNSQPLTNTIPYTNTYYGYYRNETITELIGSISTTPAVATFEGVIGCTIGYGSGNYISTGNNTISIINADGWVLPGTEILANITGTGGIGTYLINTAQNVSSTNIYAITSSTGGHTTFTATITGTTLTVTAIISGTISIGQKLYTPMAIYVDDVITDGIVSAVVTAVPTIPDISNWNITQILPAGSSPYIINGTYTLDTAVTFTAPITVKSNKLIINEYVSGQTLIIGDGITGASLLPDTYIIDQYSEIDTATGGKGVYVLNDIQYSIYNLLSVNRNILTVTSLLGDAIQRNRVVQTETGIGILPNTVIIEQISPLLPGEDWGNIGRYTVNKAQNVGISTLLLDVNIGTYYYDDYFAYKIIGYDWSADPILTYTYSAITMPPGLVLDTATGWITGIPTGIGTQRYNFTVTVSNSLAITSNQITFGVTFTSNYVGSIKWITPSNLPTITNYHISNLHVEAENLYENTTLKYKIINGQLPPGLELLDNGLIVGRVEFNPEVYQIIPNSTLEYIFTIQAYAIDYPSINSENRTFTLNVYNKYNTAIDTVYLKCTPPISDRTTLQWSDTSLFDSAPLTITGVIRTDETNNTLLCESTARLSIGSVIQFSGNTFGGITSNTSYYIININNNSIKISTKYKGSEFNISSASGYMTITGVIIPPQLLYRAADPYYGKNEQIRVDHIYGVNSNLIDAYLQVIEKHNYSRQLTLGEIKTAIARDQSGNIIYEVVYSKIIDNLVNNDGVSINYSIKWPVNVAIDQTVIAYYSSLGDIYSSWDYVEDKSYYDSLVWAYVNILYPNSLENMKKAIVDALGAQLDTSLMPLWMTSQQRDGSTLGYTPAWVICYTKPGASEIIQKNIQQLWPYTMNLINFEVDRVYVDKSLTFNYNKTINNWTSYPSAIIQPINIISTIDPNVILVSGYVEYWYVDLAFTITSSNGVAIGGLACNTVYYVRQIDTSVSPARIVVSKSLVGATESLYIETVSGAVLTAVPIHGVPLPTDSKDYQVLYNNFTIKDV